MPTVPTPAVPTVSATDFTGQRLNAPQMRNFAPEQAQQAGTALQRAGETGMAIATDMQLQANALRIDDALNQAKEAQLNLTYGKDTGFTNLKGLDAVQRPDGISLAQEYGDRFKQQLDKISSTLGNDVQRRTFQQHATGMAREMQKHLDQHEAQEFKTHSLSVSEGVISTSQREIALGYQDPDAINNAIERIKAETYRQGSLLGKSGEWQQAMARKAASNGLTLAIGAAIENNNPIYADKLLKRYAGQMDADDILKVQGHITKQIDTQIGVGFATQAVQQAAPKLAPTDFDRMINITLATESNGQRYGKDGQLLESPKGAKGEMQVLDGTNLDPGFGVKPARDNSPEERARVGRDYLQAMLARYGGDPAKAWAAYNGGPGRLDAALKNAEKPTMVNANADPNTPTRISWLSLMPAETQKYVAKNMAALGAGDGRPARPTLADIDAQLMSNPALSGNPQRLKIAREEAARQWKVQEDAIKQREEEGTSNAMRMLVANGGRFADLPASVRNAIPPKEVDNVLGFGARIAKGEDITSPLLYAKLSADPAQLRRMSDAQFFMLRRELSETDFKHFANERAKQMGGAQGSNGPGDINSGAIKQTLDARMRMLGIDPTPKDDGGKDAARVGAIRQFVDQYFMGAQREAGKKFTDAEVAQHLDGLFAKNATFRGWFSDSSGPMLGMKAGDIPSADRDALKAAFKRRGVDDPTDAQILNAYWTMKVAKR